MSAPAADISHTHILDCDWWRKNFLRHIFAFYTIDPVDLDVIYHRCEEK
jgi:hypothetical protein